MCRRAAAYPKTRGGRRSVRLLTNVVELLKFLKPLHASENEYAFRDLAGKPFDAAQWRKRHWNKASRLKESRPTFPLYNSKSSLIAIPNRRRFL